MKAASGAASLLNTNQGADTSGRTQLMFSRMGCLDRIDKQKPCATLIGIAELASPLPPALTPPSPSFPSLPFPSLAT